VNPAGGLYKARPQKHNVTILIVIINNAG